MGFLYLFVTIPTFSRDINICGSSNSLLESINVCACACVHTHTHVYIYNIHVCTHTHPQIINEFTYVFPIATFDYQKVCLCFAGSHPFCMLVLAVPLVHLCCLNAPSLCWSNDHFCWSRNQGRILDGCISTLLPNAPVFYGIICVYIYIYIYHWVQIMSHDSMAFMFAILP